MGGPAGQGGVAAQAPQEDVADSEKDERGRRVAGDEQVTQRLETLIDRLARQFVVVGPFEAGRLDVERLIAHDVGVALALGILAAEVDRLSVVLDRSSHHDSVGGDDRPPLAAEVAEQPAGVVDVLLESLRPEELHPVELGEQHEIKQSEDEPETPDPEVHDGSRFARATVRCSWDMRTNSASRT